MEVRKSLRVQLDMDEAEARRVAGLLEEAAEESSSRDEIEFVQNIARQIRGALSPRRYLKEHGSAEDED